MKQQPKRWIAALLALGLGAGLLLSPQRRTEPIPAAAGVAAAERVTAGESRPAIGEEGTASSAPQTLLPPSATREGAEDPAAQIAALIAAPHDLSDPEAHAAFVAELQRLEGLQAKRTEAKARELGLPLLTEHGSVLTGFEGEVPLYEIPHNAEVARSHGTELVRESAPYFPDGSNFQIGMWDVYWGANTAHSEMPNVTIRDDAVEGGLHASHVAGTMSAAGLDPLAKGMAPGVEVWSFSSTNVLSELASYAAQNGTITTKIFVSVHPYGVASGWEYEGAEWYGSFSNDGDSSNDVPIYLGQYGSSASSWDGTANNFPYHLIVKSAGNHNDDNAPGPGELWYLNGQTGFNYDPVSHPKSDGAHYARSGYGTIDSRASAKNVLTVGSTSDALTAGTRDPSAAVLSAFSSVGPTDDGRIKPDLVGAGESVYSTDDGDGYVTASGTSMSTASVGAAAQLLNEIHDDYEGKMMRASALKGLLIHTADDLETPGPDYRTGWGLANVKAAADLLYDDDANDPLDRIKQADLRSDDRMDYYVAWVDGNEPVRVTLSWTDEAGAWTNSHDSRTPRLVNDLNVRLVSVDGSITHYPYVMPFTMTWAGSDLDTPAITGINTVDNVEQIYVEAPAPGLYRVEVDYAGSLQGTRQYYSLILSGTYIEDEGVEVDNPVEDRSYIVTDTEPIDVVDADLVFTGFGHDYTVTTIPEGIVTVEVDHLGNVMATPTLNAFGPVEFTLTATDETGGAADAVFTVSILSTIVRVDANTTAAPGQQDGASWATAFRHLQDALAGAAGNQEIWLADGVYYPDTRNAGDSNNPSETFTLSNGIRLYGGFTGVETARGERNPNSEATVLSGDLWQDDGQQPIVSLLTSNFGDWNNCLRVVTVPGGARVTLDGVVVTAGKNVDFFDNDGGGIWVQSGGEALIANCLISGNEANGNGGGLADDGGDVKVVNCRFAGNKAGGGGGAINFSAGDVYLSHCEIRGNQASDGGAVYFDGAWAYISNCLFSGNTGFFGAGGIHVTDGWFQMVNSTMTGHSTYGPGGAIEIDFSQGKPEIFNSIIWKNMAGGSENSTGASARGPSPSRRPYFQHCVVDNSGGSSNWNSQVGTDGGNNIDADPSFTAGINPTAAPTLAGDFRLTTNSPALNSANPNNLVADQFDLDGDGDVGEQVPVDLAGAGRVVSNSVDMGAYEFGELNQIDGDRDGLSDEFEEIHGVEGELDPLSDNDGDGLTAVAEFVHGLDPNSALKEPVGDYAPMEYLGSQYLCMTYLVNPDALNFVNITIERRADLTSPLGWQESQTTVMSTVQSSSNPDLLEVTVRSLVPFGQDGMEFLRIRHDVIPGGDQTIPQSDPLGSTSVSGWNVWGP